MVYKALLWTDAFWMSYRKWCKCYSNNLLVVLRSKQKGKLKLVNPKHEDSACVNSISDSLSLITFLFNLPRRPVIFQWKQTKCFRSVKEFLHRFDSVNEKYLSIFLGVFPRIAKVTHFSQIINFCEGAHGKYHPLKVNW